MDCLRVSQPSFRWSNTPFEPISELSFFYLHVVSVDKPNGMEALSM
jgi:hypothetical protein